MKNNDKKLEVNIGVDYKSVPKEHDEIRFAAIRRANGE